MKKETTKRKPAPAAETASPAADWHPGEAGPGKEPADLAAQLEASRQALRDSEERHRLASEELQYRIRFENLITSISTRFIHLPSDRIDMGINSALHSLGEFAAVDRCYIFLFQEEKDLVDNTHEWCSTGVAPQMDRLKGLQVSRFPWFMGKIRALEGIHLSSLAELPPAAAAEREEFEREGIQSLAIVPMSHRGSIRGYLGFDSVRNQKNWSEDDLNVLKRAGEIFLNAMERKRMEEQLRHGALHDSLTGLPNRTLLIERLDRALERSRRRPGTICAVMAMDLDRFKIINDSLGHASGDRMLVNFARRLSGFLPPGTTFARISGDEFCLLVEELKDFNQATVLAERLQEALSLGFDLDGQEIYAGASIGIAMGGAQTAGPEDLLRDADTAMHRAKSAGKGRYEVFDASMHAKAVHMMTLETDLRRALERMEFRLHYQPIVSLGDSALMGFEALIRWKHPKLGMVSPADFIPLAEDTGLIVPIGRWVLWQSCKQLAEWQRLFENGPKLTMSVNLSGKQLVDMDLVRQIGAILQEAGVAPSSLKLEVTESAIMENPEKAAAILNSLRDMGIHLSLDDFGTGYSSLSYLHRFPFHNLKIDRSFVSKMEAGDKDAEIVKVINSLARNLGMDVVAEGIETEGQWALLHQLACAYGQGYYFSRPLEDTAARKLIEGGGFAARGPQLPPA